jgi:hypothetical protein
MDRPLCLPCITAKTDLPVAEVDRYLGIIEASLQLDRHRPRAAMLAASKLLSLRYTA